MQNSFEIKSQKTIAENEKKMTASDYPGIFKPFFKQNVFLCKYKVYIVIIHNKCRAADLNLSNHIISLLVPVHVVLSLVILLPIYFIYQAQASDQ
jgi:hypothetical protein